MTFAQEDDEDVVLEEIVTTGSRIRRDEFSSSSPLSVIGGQAILEQGVSNLGEALRDQAAIGTGGFNQSSILSGGGASSIDLRNLGSCTRSDQRPSRRIVCRCAAEPGR
jgi:outer membrane receptor protein involved in Fe transport